MQRLSKAASRENNFAITNFVLKYIKITMLFHILINFAITNFVLK